MEETKVQQFNNGEGLIIPFEIPKQDEKVLCSWQECERGHKWAVEVASVKCGGCDTPVVAIRMVSCPRCNEPAIRQCVRTEHVGNGQWLRKSCLGEGNVHEQGVAVLLERQVPEKYKVGEQMVLEFGDKEIACE